MSAYVTAVLHQALSMPSTREWIERLRALLPPDALPALDTRGALDSARSDYDPDTRVASP